MLDFKIKQLNLNLDVDLPKSRFWKATALDVARTMRKRTESGKDFEGKQFKPYTEAYADYREERGRSRKPTLLFTGRMLGSIRSRGYNSKGKISLSGREGAKAWYNEQMGREFFEMSRDDINEVARKVDAWLAKRNQLKR